MKIEEIVEAPFNEPIFGTCGDIVALKVLKTGKKSIIVLGGADSTIKVFDLNSGKPVADYVINILENEVELIDFDLYKNFLLFSTRDGKLCSIPLPSFEDENPVLDLSNIGIIYSDSSTVKSFMVLNDVLFIGLSGCKVKCIGLQEIATKDFEVIGTYDLEKKVGTIKMILAFSLEEDVPTVLVSTGNGSIVVLKFHSREFKLIKTLQNVVTVDKEIVLSSDKRCKIIFDPLSKVIFVAENTAIHKISIGNWKVQRGAFKMKGNITNMVLEHTSKSLVCADGSKYLAFFSLETGEKTVDVFSEETITKLSCCTHTKNSLIALLETGDFYILNSLCLKVGSKGPRRETERLEQRLSTTGVNESARKENSTEHSDRDEIRKDITDALLEHENHSELSPRSIPVDEERITQKVIERLDAMKSIAKVKPQQPTNTFLADFDEPASFLHVSHAGTLICKQDEVELSYASVSRKPVRINTFELGKTFSLGVFNDKAIVLCSQLENHDRWMLANPYKRPILRGNEQTNPNNLNQTILQRAYEQVDKLEKSDAGLSEEEKLEIEQKNTATIYFRSLESTGGSIEWSLDFAKQSSNSLGESPVIIACGVDFLAVATDCLNLRIIRFSSLQEPILRLSKPPVVIVALESTILIIYNDRTYEILQVSREGANGDCVHKRKAGSIPMELVEIVWVGFSTEGYPTIISKSGEVLSLLETDSYWALIGKLSSNRWPFAVVGSNILTYKLADDSESPRVSQKLFVEKVSVSFGLLGASAKVGSLKHKLEEKYLTSKYFGSREKDASIDKWLLKHVMLSTKLQKWCRVEGLLKRIETQNVLEKALNFLRDNCESLSQFRHLNASVKGLEFQKRRILQTTETETIQGIEGKQTILGKKRVTAGLEAHDASTLSRKSTIAIQARHSSDKKQRIF